MEKLTTGNCIINSWKNRRHFAFTTKKVGLEISAGFCTCRTCSDRYGYFLSQVQRQGNKIKYEFQYYEYSYETIGCGTITQRSRWLVLDLPTEKDPFEFLKEILNINISDIHYHAVTKIPESFKEAT